MVKTITKNRYKIFGLSIVSDIPMSDVTSIENDDEMDIDVTIEISELSHIWNENSQGHKYYVVKDNSILLHFPGISYFLVEKGERIIVSPISGANIDKVRLFLLGTCMGILLLQRRILPLHGSVISIKGKAYAFIGDSGAGKSTLARAFTNKGYKLLTDDVIAVSLSSGNIPYVTPSYPQQKLWEESLSQFGMESNDYKPLFERETKFSVPVKANFQSKPLPLAGIYELVKTSHNETRVNPLNILEKIKTIYTHTYRNFFVHQMSLDAWHFQLTTKMINEIQMFQIERPLQYFTANQLVDLVLNNIKKEEMSR